MSASAQSYTILAFGDSLTAGYGLNPGEDYPSLLEAKLREDGFDVSIHNAGVSGDTTEDGRARLEWVLGGLPAVPDITIVELGANDGLRLMNIGRMEDNLDYILSELLNRGTEVLFTGMHVPPNYGAAYGEPYSEVFTRLSEKHDVKFYPFFLEGVAGTPALNQPDGIHPNRKGTEIIAENLRPVVREMLEALASEKN